jgi:hypothetical protein
LPKNPELASQYDQIHVHECASALSARELKQNYPCIPVNNAQKPHKYIPTTPSKNAAAPEIYTPKLNETTPPLAFRMPQSDKTPRQKWK